MKRVVRTDDADLGIPGDQSRSVRPRLVSNTSAFGTSMVGFAVLEFRFNQTLRLTQLLKMNSICALTANCINGSHKLT